MMMPSRSVPAHRPRGLRALLFALGTLAASTTLNAAPRGLEAALAAVNAPTAGRLTGELRPAAPLSLDLALGGTTLHLDLRPISYRTPGFKVQVVSGGVSRAIDPGPVRTVRGSVAGLPGALAVGVVKPSGLELTLTLPGGKVLSLEPTARTEKVLDRGAYTLAPCAAKQGDRCGLSHAEELAGRIDGRTFTKSTGENCAALGGCLATIAFDTDFPFFEANSSSVAQATATVEGILALVNQRFAEFQIRHEITEIVLRTDAASDPYDEPEITSSGALLATLRDVWAALPSSAATDLIHLLAARPDPGAAAGLGYIGGVCSGTSKFAYSHAALSDCSHAAVTIHELGHNWGSIHTCGIMSPFAGSCTAAWCGGTLDAIPAQRNLVDGFCLDLIPAKNARIVSQSVPASMNGGQIYPVSVTLENTGVVAWSPVGPSCNAYRLAQVGSASWNPIRAELPAAVLPGQQVTLNFNVVAPPAGGVHNFQLRMVHECVTFFGDLSTNVAVNVTPAPVKNAQILAQTVPATMVAGQTYAASLTVKNTGSVSWSPIGPTCNAYRLGSVGSVGWNPIRVELPSALSPGSQVTLNFNVTAPASPGTYTFQWQMVHECVEWFGSQSPPVSVTVTP